ncbi:biotin/lipoyl-containing protein [Micromonospora sp. NPDC047548]|uniref:acetyl-CoA carboxylase biotin carboxyl carrier protein n=1 Tax=Micromonospora sp. NPDC047548 TaxID=3155624 RepID=UPI0033FE41CF
MTVELEWAAATASLTTIQVDPPTSMSPDTAATAGTSGADGVEYLRAPMVGAFYRAPGPDAKPFVEEGDIVEVGQQIGILEAMKLMIPVEADRAAHIVEVIAVDGTIVEFGEPLLAIVPLDAA